MTNILFLITGLNVGGAEMQIYQLIKRLNKSDNYNLIVVSMLEPGPIGDKLKEAEIKVYSLQMKRGKIDKDFIWKLNKIIKDEKVNLIHSHLFHANLLARVIKIFNPKIKIITTLHNINIGGRKRERIIKYTNFLSDSNTIISETARQYFVNIGTFPEKKLKLIPNGVDTLEFKENSELRLKTRHKLGVRNDFVWLAVGRFEEQKNYFNLMKSFSFVLETHKNVQLLLVGTGPLLEETKKMADELKIHEHTKFLGYRNDITSLMNAADAYVMSSSWEGMPIVLLEASAVGLPIVCTDVGGNKEVVVDSETGFIVKPNCYLSLANKMNQLMNLSSHERIIMGEKATEHINRRYEIDRIVIIWKEMYKEMLS